MTGGPLSRRGLLLGAVGTAVTADMVEHVYGLACEVIPDRRPERRW